MTGDCHVRFCERLRGETPLCLLGVLPASEGLCARKNPPLRTRKACLRKASSAGNRCDTDSSLAEIHGFQIP